MSVNVYRSTDAGAPTIDGTTPGKLIALLDACLVNGYGTQASAGWTKPYSGTNTAVYRQAGGNQFYLHVDDTSPVYYGNQLTGYESMSGISTGTGMFPATNQRIGSNIIKSNTSDTTVRDWRLVASQTIFYLWINAQSSSYLGTMFCFGDFLPYMSTDKFNIIIAGDYSSTDGWFARFSNYTNPSIHINSTSSIYSPRSYTQTGTSVEMGHYTNFSIQNNSSYYGAGYTGMSSPESVSGSLIISPVYINELSASIIRGTFPGLWCIQNNSTSNPSASSFTYFYRNNDTFSGSGSLAGKQFEVFCVGSSTSSGYVTTYLIETSNTW